MPDIRGAVALSTNYPLDKAKHGSPDLHKIGQSLLDPTFVAPIPYSATGGAVGQSDEVARADHVHPFPQAAIDAINSAGTSGSLGDSTYNQVNTPVSFASFNPIRFNSTVPPAYGSGEKNFYYIRQGPIVDWFARFGVASDSTWANGALQIWIPLGLNAVSSDVPCGNGRLVDAGGGAYHVLPIAISSGAGYTVFQLINEAQTWYVTNPGTPMTWTAGDYGRVQGRYYCA